LHTQSRQHLACASGSGSPSDSEDVTHDGCCSRKVRSKPPRNQSHVLGARSSECDPIHFVTINNLSHILHSHLPALPSLLFLAQHATSITLSLRRESKACTPTFRNFPTSHHIRFTTISLSFTNPHATLARRCPASIRRLNKDHPTPMPTPKPMSPRSRPRSSSRSQDSPEGLYRPSWFTPLIS